MMMTMIYMILMIPLMVSNVTFIYIQFMYLFIYLTFIVMCPPCSFFSCVSYYLGVDYYSYGLMIMSIIICSLMKISMMSCAYKKSYKLINLFLMIFMFFIFTSMSFLFMYISFEFILLPLMILIFGWGYQPERLISGLYLFFYTLLTSFPLFIMILKIYSKKGSFFFDYLMMMDCNFIMYFFMLFALLVKFPMFMFHFWLPLAHVQAPVSGSMILAGLMLKIGGYGLIRLMFMYEYMYMYYSYIWFSISLVGSFVMGLLCLLQGDMKCLVAYSSICHMGMCIMGLMTMKTMGLMGSYLLMLGHGFCSSGLFYMVNMIYVRTSSRSFFVNKGMFMYMPSCSMFFFILCCFNMSCPPSLNFISELMILFSMMCYWGNSFVFFFMTSFICACFSYYLYSYTYHGVFHNLYSFSSTNILESLCIFMHLTPLVGLCLVLMN